MKNKILIGILSIINIVYADCSLIDKDVKSFINKNEINGVAIVLMHGSDIEYCNYGYSDLAKKNKITKNTIFEIASITKTFTANIAGIAQIEGKYDLYKPITTYLPELTNTYYQKINSVDLLTHTANIPFKLSDTSTETALFNALNLVKYAPTAKPNLFYSYSNPGIAIVGAALEHVYKESYQDILQTKILNKLGMKNTFVDLPLKFNGILSDGFDKNNKMIPLAHLGALVPTGGLKSNTEDLALYLNYQINGSNDNILNKALELLHKDYYCINNNKYQQLAWQHFSNQDLNTQFNDKQTLLKQKITNKCKFKNGFIEKTGTSLGMSSYMAYSPVNKIGMVILLNKGLVGDRVNLGRTIIKTLENID